MAINNEEDFINLIKKSEIDAAASPALYTAKLALFALLGYLVIFGVLLSLLGLVGGLGVAAFFSSAALLFLLKTKLIIIALPIVWVMLRALWVKFVPPRGYPLKRRDYPVLFGELDAVSKRLKALKIHEVILDDSLNAGIVQHPRLGVLGWYKNYLMIGYQLMLTLSPEEMRSVLAHEFGHLSRNHSRFSGWIYRVRTSWLRIMEAFDQSDSVGALLMRRFFDWYSPRFEAYSFALARSNEYDADGVAAALTSPEIASRALMNVHATAPYLDEHYWSRFYESADDTPEPQHAPFEGLVEFLKGVPLEKEEFAQRINNEMAVETHYLDTHPSLKDRVAAIGASPQTPSRADINAAEAWLQTGNRNILKALDRDWLDDNREDWAERYHYVQDARRKLQQYSRVEHTELRDDELCEYAWLADEFVSGSAAVPLFQAYQQRCPKDPDSAHYLARALLAQQDDAGLAHLRTAGNSPALIEEVAHIGYDYLMRQGKEGEAEAWWQESVRQNEVHTRASIEREKVDIYDQFLAPGPADPLRQQFIDSLKVNDLVDQAWLARKVVHYHPEYPVYVIAVRPKKFTFFCGRLQSRLAHTLNVNAAFLIVCTSGGSREVADRVIETGERIL